MVSESQVCQALMLRRRFPSATFELSVWMAKLDDLEGKDGGPTLLQRSLRIYGRWFYEVRVLVGRKLEEVWLHGHRHHSTMGGWHCIPPCIEWDISKITLKEAWRYLWKKGRWQHSCFESLSTLSSRKVSLSPSISIKFKVLWISLMLWRWVLEDELQALLLLSLLPKCWETLVVSLSNSAPNGVVS